MVGYCVLLLDPYCRYHNLSRYILSKVSTLIIWSIYFSVRLVCMSAYFPCASVAMSQPNFITPLQRRNNKPFLLHLWRVTNPSTANATTSINYQQRTKAYYRGVRFDEHANCKNITQTFEPTRLSLWVYQTGILGTILFRTPTTARRYRP